MPIRMPSYRFHKARSCSVVTISGMGSLPGFLIVLGKIPASFDYTRGTYGLHGRLENLTIADSLPEATEVWKY